MFDSATAATPEGLEQLAPGPTLADFLSIADTGHIPGHDRVLVLRAHQRMASYYQAQVYRDMAALPDSFPDLDDDPALAHDAAATEIRAALHLTRRAAEAELAVAVELSHRLPSLWGLLRAGQIDARRARAILHHTSHLDDELARRVVGQILDEAPRLTTGQLAARLRRLCIQADPGEAARRYEHAIDRRQVVMEPTAEGTATLVASHLPPDRAAAAMAHISRLAHNRKNGCEARSIDQLRSDIMLELLCGEGTSSGRGVVDLQVDLATLAELAEHPGQLAGYGPVIADIARQTAGRQPDAEWRYTITESGRVIGGGITRRRPRVRQRREVQARDRTCVFPGCRMPATACDLDHRVPYSDGGPTEPSNLVPLCRHDHRIRHQAGWTHQPLPNGDHQWTSPLRHVHTASGKPP